MAVPKRTVATLLALGLLTTFCGFAGTSSPDFWLLSNDAAAADASAATGQRNEIGEVDRLIRGAEAAFLRDASAEAVEQFRSALAALDETQPDSAAELRQTRRLRQRALYQLAQVLRRQGDHAEALRYAMLDHDELMKASDPLLQLSRQNSAIGIATDLIALSDYQAAEVILSELENSSSAYGELHGIQKLSCLSLQAVVADQTGKSDGYHRRWNKVGAEAAAMLNQVARSSSLLDLREPTQALVIVAADALSQPGIHDVSDSLFRRFDLNQGEAAQRTLIVRVAMFHILRRDFANAERYFRRALRLASSNPVGDQLARGQLHSNIAMCLSLQQRHEEASRHWTSSATEYESILGESAGTDTKPVPEILSRLVVIYRKLGQHDRAVDSAQKLLQHRMEHVGDRQPLTMDARALLATTLASSGQYSTARLLLQTVEAFWRARQPRFSDRLARTLSNQGAVEKALGNSARAQTMFEEALRLQSLKLQGQKGNSALAIAYGNHASSLLDEGRYAEAVQQFEQVLKLCEQLGDRAASLKAATLLNVANAFRTQGQYDQSLVKALEALDEYSAHFDRHAIGAIPFLQSLAAIHRETGQFEEAYETAQEALSIVLNPKGQQHPLMAASVRSTLAGICDLGGSPAAAEEHWKQAQAIYEMHHQPLAVARILNRRAVIAILNNQDDAAAQFLGRARKLLEEAGSSTIELHNVLANQAEVLRRQGRHGEAGKTIAAALELLEKPRIEASGAGIERAQFLVRFGSAYDKAIEWAIADGDLEAAFALAERRRSRTLLDDLRTAGVDLQKISQSQNGDVAPDTKRLLARERELRAELSELCYRQYLAHAEDESADEKPSQPPGTEPSLALLSKEYQTVVSSLRSRNPLYRELLRQADAPVGLAGFRSLLRDDQIALVWMIGQESGYVMSVGSRPDDTAAFRLNLNASLPQWVDTLSVPGDGTVAPLADHIRGLKRRRKPTSADAEGFLYRPATGDSNFTVNKCARFVEWYRVLIERRATPLVASRKSPDSASGSEAGRSGENGSLQMEWKPGVDDLTFQRLAAFSSAVFPDDLLDWLADRRAKSLIAIPDGPLHRLPVESLVLRHFTKPAPSRSGEAGQTLKPPSTAPSVGSLAYALEVLPPITYVASASLLVELKDRQRPIEHAAQTEKTQLLLVGDPAYPDHATQLPRLPGTAVECETVAEMVSRDHVTPVLRLGEKATESQIRQVIETSQFLHFAAHGLVDEQTGNLLGAIALSPPLAGEAGDGFLTYQEISGLDLSRCRLAVLSACRTFDGPQRPLEAGSSLGQAFLAAGTQSVIASHWNVVDQSTAQLMSRFYARLFTPQQPVPELAPAAALRAARLHLATDSAAQAPWYWAPFIHAGLSK